MGGGFARRALAAPQDSDVNARQGRAGSRHHRRGLVSNLHVINFGGVGVGTTAARTMTLSNMSMKDVTVTNVSTSTNSFGVSGLSLPHTVAAGEAVSFHVQFTPRVVGTQQDTLTVDSNAVDSVMNVGLMGDGAQGQITVSPSSVNFGSIATGANVSKSVVVTNGGNAPLNVTNASVNGAEFSLSGPAAPMLMVSNQSATFTVKFAPTSAGSATGSLTLACDSPPTQVVVPLFGAGNSGPAATGQLSANPNSVSFGSVTDGTTSSQTIRLSNTGPASLTVLGATVSGLSFGMSGLSVPLVLPSKQSTTFNAQFAPQSPGSVTGAISLVTDVAASLPVSIALTGAGAAASLTLTASPPSVTFGNVTVGSSSTQSVTLLNTGNSNVSVQQVNASGTGFTASNSGLPVTLSSGQSVAVNVVFAPPSPGPASGNLSVASTASNSPGVQLNGTGMQQNVTHSAALTWDPSASAVAGYNVYRSTQSGTAYAKLTPSADASTTYTDTTVQSGTTYYYVVTAVDSAGNESSFSNEAKAVIP